MHPLLAPFLRETSNKVPGRSWFSNVRPADIVLASVTLVELGNYALVHRTVGAKWLELYTAEGLPISPVASFVLGPIGLVLTMLVPLSFLAMAVAAHIRGDRRAALGLETIAVGAATVCIFLVGATMAFGATPLPEPPYGRARRVSPNSEAALPLRSGRSVERSARITSRSQR